MIDNIEIVGITGRSGSGKSLVSCHYASLGYAVVDADKVAYDVTSSEKCLKELEGAFGKGIINPSGELNRQKLANVAFGAKNLTKLLADITHPHIIKELLLRAEKAEKEGAKIFFVDGAVIIGSLFEKYCSKIILVETTDEIAASRIMKRDNITEKEATKRLNAQMTLQKLKKASNYIIDNNGTKEQLILQAENVLQKLLFEVEK